MAGPVVEEAVLSGRRYDGAAAVAAGIAHGTAPADKLVDEAIAAVEPLTGKARAITVALKEALHAPVLAHLDG
jgi:Delta3-Delta2-enoyl-CoA isomerase